MAQKYIRGNISTGIVLFGGLFCVCFISICCHYAEVFYVFTLLAADLTFQIKFYMVPYVNYMKSRWEGRMPCPGTLPPQLPFFQVKLLCQLEKLIGLLPVTGYCYEQVCPHFAIYSFTFHNN